MPQSPLPVDDVAVFDANGMGLYQPTLPVDDVAVFDANGMG